MKKRIFILIMAAIMVNASGCAVQSKDSGDNTEADSKVQLYDDSDIEAEKRR